MLFKETITQAWHSLVAHRFRAGLTMLGIAWGILTVTSLMAYGNGFERALIVDALARAGGVQTRAAALLGMSERHLRYKLKKHGIER